MNGITKRFSGKSKLTIKFSGVNDHLILELKNDDSFLSIRDGSIVGYRCVNPQPYKIRDVSRIIEAGQSYRDAVPGSIESVESTLNKVVG